MYVAILISLLVSTVLASPITPAWQNHVDLFTTKSRCSEKQELLSCGFDNSTASVDECCVEAPGGVVLFTQLWNTDVPNSPSHTWTIHGSWPDNCDGSYGAFCNFENTEVQDIEQILREHGEDKLVDYMNQFWLNNNGSNKDFWLHEFNKHGTCMSTIRPSCYGNYTQGQNVVDFFKMSVRQYHNLPTFTWLADAGIVPSYTQTYKAEDIQAALTEAYGYEVFLGCTNGTEFSEVWYFNHVQGSLLSQNFVKMNTLTKSTCKGDIKYTPKQGDSFKLW